MLIVISIEAWGLTETSPANTVQGGIEGQLKPSSVGMLLSQVEARIVLQGTERDAPQGMSGELWIRGPHVMKVNLIIFTSHV